MPLKLTPTPADLIKKYGRLHHHHGVKVLCQVAWINTRGIRGGESRQWLRLGIFCPFCGLVPSKATREWQVQVLEQMMGTKVNPK